jgi:FkbM family methyltransferase
MSAWWNRHRFDLVELSLIAFCAGIVCWDIGRSELMSSINVLPSEAESLELAYGPMRPSVNFQEWIIRDHFKDCRGGFFIDIGANHYKVYNNTYYLETQLGWSGIAVEPQQMYEADYKRYRPRTRFVPLFVADVSNESARMYILEGNPWVSSARKDFTGRWGKDAKEVSVPTITLDDLLVESRASKIDFLSINVELSEPKVLAGFDIERAKPAFVCIEAQPEVRQQILDFFARHRYVVVGKYLRADIRNLYFVPLD